MQQVAGLAVLLSVLLPASAWAYYVAPQGDDSGDGSAAHPWATIQHAADLVEPGDTVCVMPGEYHEAVHTRISGTETARIRFVSQVRWGAKIRTTGGDACWSNRGDYVDIEGFDMSGDGSVGLGNGGSYAHIVGNHVHDVPALNQGDNGGAGIANHSHDSDVIGNVVHDIGDPQEANSRVHGIYLFSRGGHVVNNICYRNQGLGIHCWHAATDATIANNLMFENATGGMVVGNGDSPGGVLGDNFLVTNNISVYNGKYGIEEYGALGTHNRYLNNLVFGNKAGDMHLLVGVAEGTVTADPKFVNYRPDGTGDYHLAPGSPAIGAGTPLGAPSIDIDGTARPQGRYDIGPYAYLGRP